ncbi:MAG: DinB family protein [Fimbriimonadales bacterium]
MQAKQYLIQLTREQLDAVFRNARAVPADKLEWRPLDQGRSVLDQVRECAGIPRLLTRVLKERSFQIQPEEMDALRSEWSTWSLDDAEQIGRRDTDEMLAVLEAMTDDELGTSIPVPFFGGRERTLLEIASTHAWNLIYHTGQIAYIQTLLGDRQMH